MLREITSGLAISRRFWEIRATRMSMAAFLASSFALDKPSPRGFQDAQLMNGW